MPSRNTHVAGKTDMETQLIGHVIGFTEKCRQKLGILLETREHHRFSERGVQTESGAMGGGKRMPTGTIRRTRGV